MDEPPSKNDSCTNLKIYFPLCMKALHWSSGVGIKQFGQGGKNYRSVKWLNNNNYIVAGQEDDLRTLTWHGAVTLVSQV